MGRGFSQILFEKMVFKLRPHLVILRKRCAVSGFSVVKNPPASAGDTGLIPGPRKIPHATEQLSP